jgi:hypothetical protein
MACLPYIHYQLKQPVDHTNRNVFFDSKYTAQYLTTHGDYYLDIEQIVFDF